MTNIERPEPPQDTYNWPVIYGGVVALLVGYIALGFLITAMWT
jgi:hypothetical protein